jgi:hypothetical protein
LIFAKLFLASANAAESAPAKLLYSRGDAEPFSVALGVGVLGVGVLGVGALGVGALDVGALGVGALDVGALDVGALDVGALGVGTPLYIMSSTKPTPTIAANARSERNTLRCHSDGGSDGRGDDESTYGTSALIRS